MALAPRDFVVALGLVGLALLWRLPGLTSNPGWDGDEGYNLDIAWHLLHGQAQMFAVDYAFVQHPILSYALLAPLLGLLGPELWVLRAVGAAAGAVSVGALYLAGAMSGRRRGPLLASLAMAGATFAVAYNRLGYTYNLLLLWTALTLLAVTRWEDTRRPAWLWVATGLAALGLLTDQVGIALPLFVALRAWPRRRLCLKVLLGGCLPALLAAGITLVWRPETSLADWHNTLGRLVAPAAGAQTSSPAIAIARWILNYYRLLHAEWWWPAAIAGLFCIRPIVARRRVMTLAGLLAVPIFALRDLDPFFRAGIPLLLPGAWGLGALLDAGMRAAYETGGGRRRATVLAALVVLLPLGLEMGRTTGGLSVGFSLPIDWGLVAVPEQRSARDAAAFVNARIEPADVVVVSPHVAWLYRGQVADFLQGAAAGGEAVAFYPAGLSARRFRFDPSPDGLLEPVGRGAGDLPQSSGSPARNRVRYAVLDTYWDRWATESAPVARIAATVEAWPLEWAAGTVRVHRRPAP